MNFDEDYESDFEEEEEEEVNNSETKTNNGKMDEPAKHLENLCDVKSTWKEVDLDEVEMGEMIGGGGFALVYTGYYRDEKIAMKCIFDPKVDKALKEEFMNELLIMAKVNHPNIVSLIGACLKPPKLAFVMELCDYSLYQLLHASTLEIPKKTLVNMSCDIASAMEYLHSLSPAIIHRDIKSHNLLVDSKGRIKVCDFGLASTMNTTAGTPNYMSPELLQNKTFNKSVDVYAFGILLSEMFVREVPYDGYSAYDIRSKVISGERPRVPTIGCPEEICELMQDCWSQNPKDRPSFETIVRILDSVRRSIPDVSAIDELAMMDEMDCLSALMSSTGK